MDYKIVGQTVPVVEVTLNSGESMYTQSGGMAYQTEGIKMNTNARGGIMKSIGRVFAGESMFMANYTAEKDGATVAFASTVPGSIVPFDLSKYSGGLTFQKGSFLCAQSNVETSVTFTKRFSAGLFGGEGLFLTRLVGPGKVILQSQNFGEFAGRILNLMPKSK